jgi:hypothetical protein
MFISSQQSRAARGLLHWKLADLAAASGLGLSTIKHFEVSIRTTTRRILLPFAARSRKPVLSLKAMAGLLV